MDASMWYYAAACAFNANPNRQGCFSMSGTYLPKPIDLAESARVDPAKMQILRNLEAGAARAMWVTFRLPGQRRVCQPVCSEKEAQRVYWTHKLMLIESEDTE